MYWLSLPLHFLIYMTGSVQVICKIKIDVAEIASASLFICNMTYYNWNVGFPTLLGGILANFQKWAKFLEMENLRRGKRNKKITHCFYKYPKSVCWNYPYFFQFSIFFFLNIKNPHNIDIFQLWVHDMALCLSQK